VALETSILIPTLDDAPTLGDTIERLNRLVAATGTAAEVIVVDAGSRDGTLTLAAELADRFPLLHMRILVQDRTRSGFGSLVRLGIAYAEGRFCVLVMADARDPLEVLPEMLKELRGGAHLVLCSRYEGDPADTSEATVPARFRTYQAVYRRAIRLLLGFDIPDSTYGFRAFHRTFVTALGLSANRFAVCPEITFKVMLARGRVVRVPGAQSGPTVRTQSKFRLRNELAGYAVTLLRASLHRVGVHWF
jgi:glycosyltransferase involved in cell wall biosynthesis